MFNQQPPLVWVYTRIPTLPPSFTSFERFIISFLQITIETSPQFFIILHLYIHP
ncbi:unnamed protein product [Prunus brigantina]